MVMALCTKTNWKISHNARSRFAGSKKNLTVGDGISKIANRSLETSKFSTGKRNTK